MAAYCQSQLHAVEYCNERATVQIAVLGFAVPECVKGFFSGDRDAHTAVSKKLSIAGRLLAAALRHGAPGHLPQPGLMNVYLIF